MGCKAPQAMEWDGVGMTDTAKRLIEAANPYTRGARVTHKGQTWENTGSNANVWEPGVFGWVLV